jgi:hypothetical protein
MGRREVRLPLAHALFAAAWMALAAPGARAEEIVWSLGGPSHSVTAQRFSYHSQAHAGLRGATEWDPCWLFRLPNGPIDADRFRYLEVRLYSSAPADLLDIYCKAPDGEWGLMGRHAIVRGWATYRVDLASLTAHECSGSPGSRKWGSTQRRVAAFRIDPGNEAGRWVALSSIRLTDQPLADSVTPEPRGEWRTRTLEVEPSATAGRPIRVKAALVPAPGAPATVAASVRLLRGGQVIADRDAPLASLGTTKLDELFPTSRFMPSGDMAVEVDAYELQGAPVSAEVALRNPREGVARMPAASVRRARGEPTLVVDGKPMVGMAYLTASGRHPELHSQFARAGIHLYMDWFGGSSAGALGHVAKDRYDYGEFDAYFAEMLDADPQALFIPHLYLTPPLWWQESNPTEMCRHLDGTADLQSFASEKWRREMGDDLRRLLAHIRSSCYADRILGFILCSGVTAEWQQWGVWGDKLADASEPQRRAFAAWRRAHGRPDDGLPTAAERAGGDAMVLRDPRSEQRVIDYTRFASETIADAIARFAGIVKTSTAGRAVVGAYYGYLTQHGPHQQDAGHLALDRLLSSPHVDFLMSPPMYTGREVGGTSAYMSAEASVRLRGKLWLNESDIRTSLSDPGAGFGRADTLDQSRALLLREFGEMLARRSATSWFDMDSGWFDHPSILRDMSAMRRLAADALRTRKPFRSEIAVFICADSAYRMKPSMLWVPAVLTPIAELPRVGAPADVYLLSDLQRPDFPAYKVYVFLNAASVDEATRRAIDRKVKRPGAAALWCFAPGALTDQGLSAAAMQSLTGIRLAMEPRPSVQQVEAAPSAPRLPDFGLIGWDQPYGPTVWADDPAAETLGLLRGSGRPGLVRKRINGWTSVAFTGVGLPPPLLREIARQAGVHIWLDSNDALDTDTEWLCLHARGSSPKTLRLPAPSRVTNAMTGQVLSPRATQVTVTMEAGETLLLCCTKPPGP